jgi:hypothetical protein
MSAPMASEKGAYLKVSMVIVHDLVLMNSAVLPSQAAILAKVLSLFKKFTVYEDGAPLPLAAVMGS